MPAPNTEQVGVNFLLKAGTALVGGSTNATLKRSSEIKDTNTKDHGRWKRGLASLQAFEIGFEGMYLENGHEMIGQGSSLLVDVDGVSTALLMGITSMTLELSLDLAEAGAMDKERWMYKVPTLRGYSLSVSANYFDPESANGAGMAALLAAKEQGISKEVTLGFGTSQYVGAVNVAEVSYETPVDGITPVSLTLPGDGLLMPTQPNVDPGLDALLQQFFADDPQALTALIETVNGARAPLADATGRVGLVYPSSISIEIPLADPIKVSGTLTGTGPLTRYVQGAQVNFAQSGGSGETINTHALRGVPGTVRLDYEMFSEADEAELIYDGEVVASTGGLVSGQGTLTYEYAGGAPAEIQVRINAPAAGTNWEYTLTTP